ncbi:hypothetical protein J1614_005492 [Plenodomus biglobosus]|nr:hypothetical protein J1614_005492 [Plenodomus biglobosus]
MGRALVSIVVDVALCLHERESDETLSSSSASSIERAARHRHGVAGSQRDWPLPFAGGRSSDMCGAGSWAPLAAIGPWARSASSPA